MTSSKLPQFDADAALKMAIGDTTNASPATLAELTKRATELTCTMGTGRAAFAACAEMDAKGMEDLVATEMSNAAMRFTTPAIETAVPSGRKFLSYNKASALAKAEMPNASRADRRARTAEILAA